jgi:hypothetical protein
MNDMIKELKVLQTADEMYKNIILKEGKRNG